MRIRITKRPSEMLGELSLEHYRQGEVYDIPSTLAEYLVMEKCAIIEMRDPERPHEPVPVERRKRPPGRQAGEASISS
jgi:hypothetical protein